MRVIDDHDELVALCGGDTLCRWVAQGLDGRGRAWASEDGRALAVAGTGVSRRDRIAVSGPAASVVPLVRDDAGRLTALAALAWSAPSVSLVAGVGVHPKAQGQGLGRAVCDFVLAEALRRYGAAALMVDAWNEAAVRLYRRLGMSYRPTRAAYADRPFMT